MDFCQIDPIAEGLKKNTLFQKELQPVIWLKKRETVLNSSKIYVDVAYRET